MRIMRIVYDHGPAKPVTVLSGHMAMVPERPRLVETGELVGERVTRGNRALVHKGGAILPVGACLIHTVEMLSSK